MQQCPGAAFVVPTYLFIGSLGLLPGLGILRVAAGDQAVANGYSRYFDGDGGVVKEFDNLVLLRFDAGGRCVEYREWYMRKPDEGDD